MRQVALQQPECVDEQEVELRLDPRFVSGQEKLLQPLMRRAGDQMSSVT